jgi:hypothetical protein
MFYLKLDLNRYTSSLLATSTINSSLSLKARGEMTFITISIVIIGLLFKILTLKALYSTFLN